MKKINQTTLSLLVMMLFSTIGFSQMAPVKKFDYSILEKKKLYIPTFEANEKFIQKMSKKGKYDKIADAKEKAAYYNKIWKEAMAESSYDATDYEIRAFDRKQLVKSKDKEAILMYFVFDDYGNGQVSLLVTGPKQQIIASSIINGLDLGEKNDIRLMMNMLNESLNTASELNEEGSKTNMKGMRSKYKEGVVEFYDNIGDKTFLVPKSEHKNEKKAAERNADLKEALKTWKLSKYEFTTEEEIENKRIEGDPDYYYWRDFPIYSAINGVRITYHFNVIISADSDDVLFSFMGKKRLKPETLEQIQSKIVTKANRYKKQLGK
ncbi:MAG: hypothetical protein KDD41_11425 [Flavobacteriales bacterium]|nr:hypothetical protein [Flavobacteriales bacterium]